MQAEAEAEEVMPPVIEWSGQAVQGASPETVLNVSDKHAVHVPDAKFVPVIKPEKPLLHVQSLAESDPEGLPLFDGHELHDVSVLA
jgi:hypothetical protein